MAKHLLQCLFLLISCYYSCGHYCGNCPQIFMAADNRALAASSYRKQSVSSRIHCVRNCHADYPNCKSVNYDEIHHLCELNNATIAQFPDNLITHFGSVYYDGNMDTPLLSHAHPDTTVSSMPRYSSCQELLEAGQNVSGVFTIFPARFADGLQVYCDMETDGGGWIVFQRRQDGSVDFYRDWADYRVGFGNLSGEFWLGNDILRNLTEYDEVTWQIRLDMTDWNFEDIWFEYGEFRVTGDQYQLNVGSYNTESTAGNALDNMYEEGRYSHNGMLFTTKDNDNDRRTRRDDYDNELNCGISRRGDHSDMCTGSLTPVIDVY
ncbi:fibrinogen C domain-containing protein 1-like [Asterias rubens]|uniref:fibrinogen C domain-containing protein 1-like n=1 Tax=Asterias rubens TaxID=7604 RepID=UPI001455B30A|nr:fibrinogen C domain-containing protein 1-like [Asterias rubens]